MLKTALLAALLLLPLAAQRTPLPALALGDPNGGSVNLDRLGFTGTWTLVYTQPQCKPCAQQLQLLKAASDAGFASRIVIVGGGMTARELQSLQRSTPHLRQARWYTDVPRGLPRGLRLRGAPVLLGVRANRLEWTLNGIPPKQDLLRNSVLSWMRTR